MGDNPLQERQLAAAWVAALRGRGVRFHVRGRAKVTLLPPSIYHTLTEEERVFFRHHKRAIVEAIEQVLNIPTGVNR